MTAAEKRERADAAAREIRDRQDAYRAMTDAIQPLRLAIDGAEEMGERKTTMLLGMLYREGWLYAKYARQARIEIGRAHRARGAERAAHAERALALLDESIRTTAATR